MINITMKKSKKNFLLVALFPLVILQGARDKRICTERLSQEKLAQKEIQIFSELCLPFIDDLKKLDLKKLAYTSKGNLDIVKKFFEGSLQKILKSNLSYTIKKQILSEKCDYFFDTYVQEILKSDLPYEYKKEILCEKCDYISLRYVPINADKLQYLKLTEHSLLTTDEKISVLKYAKETKKESIERLSKDRSLNIPRAKVYILIKRIYDHVLEVKLFFPEQKICSFNMYMLKYNPNPLNTLDPYKAFELPLLGDVHDEKLLCFLEESIYKAYLPNFGIQLSPSVGGIKNALILLNCERFRNYTKAQLRSKLDKGIKIYVDNIHNNSESYIFGKLGEHLLYQSKLYIEDDFKSYIEGIETKEDLRDIFGKTDQ